MLVSAAAPLSKDLVDLMYARLKIPVKQAFGLSETSPASHQQEWEEWNMGIGSVGRPVPNLEAKIVDIKTLYELGPNQVGEMWVRGPNVFKGYLDNPAATKEALTEDGWFRTGDVGYVDERGLFFITDRIKELIKFNGFQIAPAGELLHTGIDLKTVVADHLNRTRRPPSLPSQSQRRGRHRSLLQGIRD